QEVVGHVEGLPDHGPGGSAPDDGQLPAAVNVVQEHLDGGGVDLQLVPARRGPAADALGGGGAGVRHEDPVEAPEVGDVLVARQDHVDVELGQHGQEVAGVGDDVALPPRPGNGHQVVVDGEDLDVVRPLELLA